MRISTYMLQQSAMRSIRIRQEALARAQSEATSGRRVNTLSDDPLDAAQIMRLEGQARDIDQFRRNGTTVKTRLSTEDVVLTSARDLLQKAKELAIGVANAPPGDPLRQDALVQIATIRNQLISLGNTRLGDEFIFGGGHTTTPPFLADGTYVGDAITRQTEIDDGVKIDVNHTGNQMFSAALAALDDVTLQLQSGTAAAVENAVGAMTNAQTNALSLQANTGAKLAQINDNDLALAHRLNGLLDRRDAVRDVDPAEASIRLISEQAALERAYAAVGKVMQTNLLDYLR